MENSRGDLPVQTVRHEDSENVVDDDDKNVGEAKNTGNAGKLPYSRKSLKRFSDESQK